MRLPDDAIGISDVLAYRECPRRFAFQMRRHTEGSDPPGDQPSHPGTRYGTAVHHGIALIEEEMLTDDEAVQRCFDEYAAWLEPEDADRLRADFATYRKRDATGVVTIANETEIRVPLFEWCYECRRDSKGICESCGNETTLIHFRAKIDRLYQHVQNPGVLVHRDFKSSRWRKSEEEIHADKQMWAYNCAIHRYRPECERLTQWYDQLRYGETPTYRSDEQREQMWEWVQRQVRAMLADDEAAPTTNVWCAHCEIMESCSEVRRISEWAAVRIEELAGESGKLSSEGLAERDLEEYVRDLDLIARAEKMAKRYGESVRGVLKKLSESRVEELGYERSERKSNHWSPRALRAVREMVGDETFYLLVSLGKTRVEELLDADQAKVVLDMATTTPGATTLKKL